jgi:pyruvate-formate lyase-activating enzyme
MAKLAKLTAPQIQEMLKKSRAFRQYISQEEQERILENAAKLTPRKKVELIELLSREYEQIKARKEKEASILEDLNTSLDSVIEKAVKKAKQLTEERESQEAEQDLNKKIKNI